jgi:hypothetical protein
MRAVLIAVVGLSTLPALAQTPVPVQAQVQVQPQVQPQAQPPQLQQLQYQQQEEASLRPMTKPVIVEREVLLERLSSMNEKLSEALGRSKKDKRLQKLLEDARAELKDVGRQVTSAPAYQPAQPVPPPQNRPPPPPPPQQQVQPISDAMLRSMVSAIQNEPFPADKMLVLEEATPTQYFLVSQVQQILPLFKFSQDRLKAMRLLRPRILDLDNGYRLYSSFEFSNDKEELKRILQ